MTITTTIAPAAIDWMIAMTFVSLASSTPYPMAPASPPTITIAPKRSITLARGILPASSAAATPTASGRFERNTTPTSANDTDPPNKVSPIAIDSGIPSSTIPTVRFRAVVASAPDGSLLLADRRGLLDGLFGVFALGAPVQPRGEAVVAERAHEQPTPAGARPASP